MCKSNEILCNSHNQVQHAIKLCSVVSKGVKKTIDKGQHCGDDFFFPIKHCEDNSLLKLLQLYTTNKQLVVCA